MNAVPTAATKQIEVQIMGQSYLLACPPGGESTLLDAVERVDTTMCRIRDAGKVRARDRIAVLASLNLAFELSQLDAGRLRENTAQADGSGVRARLEALIQQLDDALRSDSPQR